MYIYPRIPNICCRLSNLRGCKVMCYQVCAVTILQEEISSTLQWASLKTFSLILRFTHSLAFPLSLHMHAHTCTLYILYITISISSLNYRTFRQCCKTQRYIYLLLWNLTANKRKKNNKILHSMHCLYCYLHC